MSTQNEVPSSLVTIPEIVVTEPSPLVQKPSVTPLPVRESVVPTGEETSEVRLPGVGQGVMNASLEQTFSIQEQDRDSSSEFSPAEDYMKCAVTLPEAPSGTITPSEQAEPTTESSTSDPEEFRTYGCCHINIGYEGPYESMWNILESRYAIILWLLAMILPVSAGIMGAVYMFSCPAANSLPNMIFMIGVSLMAVFTIRICIIIHRITWEDENSRSMLQTINLICVFITSLFFITESATFWQMNSSTHPGAKDFCHPTFSTFAFWWNIATSVFMIIVLTFPIA